jgi:HlyD family secretion protein
MATVTVVDQSRPRLAPARRPRRRRGLVWVCAALVVCATAGLWAALGGPSPGARAKPDPVPRLLPIGVSALGRLAPEGEVIAVAPGSTADGGRVDRLLVAVGDKVASGQVIAVLDTFPRRSASVLQAQAQVEIARAKLAQARFGPKPEDVQAQEALIDKARAEFRAAERDLSRVASLVKRAAGSTQEFDDQTLKYEQARESLRQSRAQLAAMKAIRAVDIKVAEAELSQAEAALAVARAEQQATEVRSPISGRVLRIHVRPGERVGDQGIVEVGNIDVMHAVAEVYEKDVSAVQVGQEARVRVPSLGAEVAGQVVHKDLVVGRKAVFNNDPVTDTDARVVEVRIRLDPEASTKVAGLSNARAEVLINVKGAAGR